MYIEKRLGLIPFSILTLILNKPHTVEKPDSGKEKAASGTYGWKETLLWSKHNRKL